MSITRILMPAVCASWQQVLHVMAVDIAAHLRSVGPALPPLLPELLPPPEPPGLPEVAPLVLPALLPLLPPLLPPGPPPEPPAVPPEPLPLLVTCELLLLGVLPEQPLAYAAIGTVRHAMSSKQCLKFTAIPPLEGQFNVRAGPWQAMLLQAACSPERRLRSDRAPRPSP
jgi:hypothetical protein